MTKAQIPRITAQTPCQLCSGSEAGVVQTVDGKTGAPLRVVSCAGCGSVRVDPLPDQQSLDRYYKEDYREDYKGVTTPKLKHVYRAGLLALERYGWAAETFSTPRSVVDVGAGGGEFVYLCKKRGHRVRGVEANTGYANYAVETYGVDIVNDTLDCIADMSEPIDVITLFHVLEHLRDPVESLRRLGSSLPVGGQLYIEVPNGAYVDGAPNNLFFSAHLYYFSIGTLQRTVEEAGFAPVKSAEGSSSEPNLSLIARKAEPVQPSAGRNEDEFMQAIIASETRTWLRYVAKHGYKKLPRRIHRELQEAAALKRYTHTLEVLDDLYADAR